MSEPSEKAIEFSNKLKRFKNPNYCKVFLCTRNKYQTTLRDGGIIFWSTCFEHKMERIFY